MNDINLLRSVPEEYTLDLDDDMYILMNIPYENFYAAELDGKNSIEVDGVSSATMSKTKNKGLVGGSYHNKSGSKINGVTFPVRVSGDNVDRFKARKYTVASDSDALFDNKDYAYYEFGEAEVPDYYKTIEFDNGRPSFTEIDGDEIDSEKLDSETVTLNTNGRFGDYTLSVPAITTALASSSNAVVYGVIIETNEGDAYGLRHLENIWRKSELAIYTGTATEPHGNAVAPEHYESIVGQTIEKITYYTSEGIFEADGLDLLVPQKAQVTASAAEGQAGDGSVKITLSGDLPEGFEPKYDYGGLNGGTYDPDTGKLSYTGATAGTYLFTISDKKDVYADIKVTVSINDSFYVLMNIPYNDFYASELNNSVQVDGVSSATMSKPRTGSLVGGSYHENPDGSDISGIIYPVYVSNISDLDSSWTQVTDDTSYEITVSNRGQQQTTEYKGKTALFERPSYSYYVLGKEEEPDSYKKLIVKNNRGSKTYSFEEAEAEPEVLEGASATITNSSSYGDYQLSVTGLPSDLGDVSAVVLKTEDGTSYGLRHLENIWRTSNLAFSTGHVTVSHGSPLAYKHYQSIEGKTISEIDYYTQAGVYTIEGLNLYVSTNTSISAAVADGVSGTGSVPVTLSENLPRGYVPQYTVTRQEGRTQVPQAMTYENGRLYYTDAPVGVYTLTITDQSTVNSPISAAFNLTSEYPEGMAQLAEMEGTYQQLFQGATFNNQYDSYWHDAAAAVVGESMADYAVEMMKTSIGSDTYGSNAAENAFCCKFINGVDRITFHGNEISGTLNGSKVFSHNYKCIGTRSIEIPEFSGYAFESLDGNEDEFKYFILMPDTMAATYHIEFRYGSNLDELQKYGSGSYANWLAAGIDTSAMEEESSNKGENDNTLRQVIALFCEENLKTMTTSETAAQRGQLAGIWDANEATLSAMHTNPGFEKAAMYCELKEDGTGATYVDYQGTGDYVQVSSYVFYSYCSNQASNAGIYIVEDTAEETVSTSPYDIVTNGNTTTLSFYAADGTASYVKRKSAPDNNTSGGGSSGGGGSSSGNSSTGTIVKDGKKGQVSSINGIITGSGDGYSKWIQDAAGWKLQYADGTYAAGVTPVSGQTEQPSWEMINGAWYAFGADGYIETGMVYDAALNGWFYIDVNAGMKTGWQEIDGVWRHFNTASDGSKGIMSVSTTIDGHDIDANGVRIN